MMVPAHAEPAVLRVSGHHDPYAADQAWISEGMVHALGQWEHREGASNAHRRLYGERRVRSWPTRRCTVEWSPETAVAGALLRMVSA